MVKKTILNNHKSKMEITEKESEKEIRKMGIQFLTSDVSSKELNKKHLICHST